MESIQTVVVGAGVVGLAVARALAMSGREVIVLEAQDAIGTGTSSRNSEVIHAGIYYPTGSLKAELCVQGNTLLYDYAAKKGFDAKRCGKLIVATHADQSASLFSLYQKAIANGVPGMQLLSKEQALAIEPELSCVQALWSPSSGIVDSHGYMLALQGDLESHGGMVAFNSPLAAARVTNDGIELDCEGDESLTLRAAEVINAAGLYAPLVAQKIQGLAKLKVPQAFYAKGNYYSLAQKAPFTHLVYPIPEAAGLGVHLTLDLGGQARFGPDVEWLEVDHPDDINYVVDSTRSDSFYAEIRRYWPGLKQGSLRPAYSGVRPKIVGPGANAADFVIDDERQHGVPGLVNLFGIESPGLTAALAIADRVTRQLSANRTYK
jgi:L-2-hydroxyglutarate oxidase LhgO